MGASASSRGKRRGRYLVGHATKVYHGWRLGGLQDMHYDGSFEVPVSKPVEGRDERTARVYCHESNVS